jgi:hypothetical protein
MPLRKAAMLLSVALTLTLCAGCATHGPATVQGECRIFRPITSSVQDTEPTRRQVVSHNAAGVAACGWTP